MKAAERYLALMADRCREAYISERTAFEVRKHRNLSGRKRPYKYDPGPRWDGGIDNDGKEHKSTWPKIALFMIEHGLNPYTCMRRRFELVKGSVPPWPNQVASDTYLDIYGGERETVSEEDVRMNFNLDKKYCRVGIASTRYNRADMELDTAWRSLLLDSLVDISPLMRYSLARELKLEDVAARFRMSALSQYVSAPKTYDKVWGPAILPELKEDAVLIDDLVERERRK